MRETGHRRHHGEGAERQPRHRRDPRRPGPSGFRHRRGPPSAHPPLGHRERGRAARARHATTASRFALEEGISITFGGAAPTRCTPATTGCLRRAPRTARIDSLVEQPPRGILHHFAKLALVTSGTPARRCPATAASHGRPDDGGRGMLHGRRATGREHSGGDRLAAPGRRLRVPEGRHPPSPRRSSSTAPTSTSMARARARKSTRRASSRPAYRRRRPGGPRRDGRAICASWSTAPAGGGGGVAS